MSSNTTPANTSPVNATVLVGDIGGTNCRLALVQNGRILRESISTYADATHPTLIEAILAYLRDQGAEINAACLAIAGPVNGDLIKFTNNTWQFSIEQTRRDLHLTSLKILNDFEAIALALPHLDEEQLQQFGGTAPQRDKSKVVIGPGTGYGAAKLIQHENSFIALPSEGGHVSIAPSSKRELALCAWMLQHNLQITREQLLSGPGLEHIYRGVCSIDGKVADTLTAADIQTRAVDASDSSCVAALNMFCEWLGTAARDQALDALAQGGVYIAGGIVKRFIPFLRASGFRRRFEASDTMRALLEPIPVYVVTDDFPGLTGAAAQLA